MDTTLEGVRFYLNPIDSDQFIKEENISKKFEMLEQLDGDLFNDLFSDDLELKGELK